MDAHLVNSPTIIKNPPSKLAYVIINDIISAFLSSILIPVCLTISCKLKESCMNEMPFQKSIEPSATLGIVSHLGWWDLFFSNAPSFFMTNVLFLKHLQSRTGNYKIRVMYNHCQDTFFSLSSLCTASWCRQLS